MKKLGVIFVILHFAFISKAQQTNCRLLPPQYTIHFGNGDIDDINSDELSNYRRVGTSCPTDGHYSFVSYSSRCFNDDWHTLSEDHTPGDAGGNMLLVNGSPSAGMFLKTSIPNLKSNTVYELGAWLMNLCKPTRKCPFPLLPQLTFRLETVEGRVIANIVTGEVPRFDDPKWIRHAAMFTTPSSSSTLMLVMIDNSPGGCGNDFALDDITFRECVKQTSPVTKAPNTTPPVKASTAQNNPPPKKTIAPVKKDVRSAQVIKPKTDTISKTISVKQNPKVFPPPPSVLKTRENALVKRIETEAGEIKIELYDNGEIDGDTVSIFHNNVLVRSHMRLSQKPISMSITIDPSQPHHEMIMVAENLGSIPPNTSIMIITTTSNRYEVFISSSEQKNAKVVFDLKQ